MANTMNRTAQAVAVARDPERMVVKDLAWREKVINEFARVTQFLAWLILYPYFSLFFRIKVTGRENLKKLTSPFILIANHVCPSDPFFFRIILGFWTPFLPLRFMGVRQFNWPVLNFLASIGVIDLVYSLFGVFTVVPGLGIGKNLQAAFKILKVGGNVAIFPEGYMNDSDAVDTFKKGASVLARDSGVPVMPFSFRLGKKKLFRRAMTINIGQPMIAPANKALSSITESFFEAVNTLFNTVN